MLVQVGDIWHTTDGECYDEMNRGLWVVLLNALMRTEGGDWPAMPEPAANDGTWSVSQTSSAGSSISEPGNESSVPQQSIEGSDPAGSADSAAEPNRTDIAVSRDVDSRSAGIETDTEGTAVQELER